MRTAALLGLLWYMRETPSKFMKICNPSDREEDVIKGRDDWNPSGCGKCDGTSPSILQKVLMRQLRDVPIAFLKLMGLVYALNLDCPKELKLTFEVIQHLLIGD
ncbi:hypothetical protein QQF64_026174 [Cirrhinus molitorella]|uniref:Uncharacterized protein n=1 Tax=Cirrhinus molitorella TaxID=172907 RepID=A0ABR3NSC1_9TELE